MTTSSKAQVYASVLFEAALKEWLEGLNAVSTTLAKSPGLQQRLTDPRTPFADQQRILLSTIPDKTPQPVRNFLLGMLANGDITLLDEVRKEVLERAAAAGGPRPLPAEVTSAVELTPEERALIQQRLADQFGANLDFRFRVDPAILGGLVIRVGDKLLDTSVASRLAAMRQALGVAGS